MQFCSSKVCQLLREILVLITQGMGGALPRQASYTPSLAARKVQRMPSTPHSSPTTDFQHSCEERATPLLPGALGPPIRRQTVLLESKSIISNADAKRWLMFNHNHSRFG